LPPVPNTVHSLEIQKREGGVGTRVWIEDVAGLLGLVDMGVIEVHPWNSTVEDLEHPDVLVLDLDPGPGVSLQFVVDTAFALREQLSEVGLTSWPKLTGGKGVHVMVPIEPRSFSHDEAHRYSRALEERLAARQPDQLTTSAALAAREGKLFIDYLRNGRGTTAVGAFSPRARRGFPIAAPTTWEALRAGIRPDAYTLTRPGATPPRRRMRASTRPRRAVSTPARETSRSPAEGLRPRRSKSTPRAD
jgi:bifunctional non-homologous end joining protein LigD